jgi:peptidyl-prolyl cis-trans isomerase B (cyclophilin B)
MSNTAMPQSAGSAARYNVLAIVGFILAFVFNIAGLVVSLIALSQVKKTGERGRGLALAGVIISIVSIIFGIIYFAVIFPAIMNSMPTTY